MDKLTTYALAICIGVESIPTVPFVAGQTFDPPFDPPWVVKPRFGGSSIGVEVNVVDVATVGALANTGTGRAGVVVQPFLEGWSDLNVSVRRHPTLQTSEIERPLTTGVYDYAQKYLSGREGMESALRELPARLPDQVATAIRSNARALAGVLQVSGVPRIDFMWDGASQVLFNEVNPIPGGLGMYLWQEAGIERETLLVDLLDEAAQGSARPHSWLASSDGAALRMAGSISSKLR
jgi:D-alanine-D-alanine ligase